MSTVSVIMSTGFKCFVVGNTKHLFCTRIQKEIEKKTAYFDKQAAAEVQLSPFESEILHVHSTLIKAALFQERLKNLQDIRHADDEERQREIGAILLWICARDVPDRADLLLPVDTAEREEKRFNALEKSRHGEELKKIQILAKQRTLEENYKDQQVQPTSFYWTGRMHVYTDIIVLVPGKTCTSSTNKE